MLAELNKYGFQCRASSPSGLKQSTASPTISGAESRGHVFMTRDSTLNSCLIKSFHFVLNFRLANFNFRWHCFCETHK